MPQTNDRRRVLCALVIIAVFMMNLSTVNATSKEDAHAVGIAIETYLDHPSDDGFAHQGDVEKCPLLKHLTLQFDGMEILLSYNKERIPVPVTKTILGHSSLPLFRPPIS